MRSFKYIHNVANRNLGNWLENLTEMKNVFKWSTLVVAFSLLCTYSYASPLNNDPVKMSVKVHQPEANTLMLRLANLQKVKTNITLHDLEGNDYFSRRVTDHNGYLIKLNLADVPEGRYIMRIRQANGQEIAQVIYKSDGDLMLSQLTRR